MTPNQSALCFALWLVLLSFALLIALFQEFASVRQLLENLLFCFSPISCAVLPRKLLGFGRPPVIFVFLSKTFPSATNLQYLSDCSLLGAEITLFFSAGSTGSSFFCGTLCNSLSSSLVSAAPTSQTFLSSLMLLLCLAVLFSILPSYQTRISRVKFRGCGKWPNGKRLTLNMTGRISRSDVKLAMVYRSETLCLTENEMAI